MARIYGKVIDKSERNFIPVRKLHSEKLGKADAMDPVMTLKASTDV
tara:strand:+ start:309 stop:446 length:138 start_codon:yes stop_codon:yes gene_type:complete